MKWSTAGFITLALGIAWKFSLLILAFITLIAIERIVEHLIHHFRRKEKKRG